jgi:hypothetical protein
MLKRWDTKNYDVELILAVFNSICINVATNIPKPRKYDIKLVRRFNSFLPERNCNYKGSY